MNDLSDSIYNINVLNLQVLPQRASGLSQPEPICTTEKNPTEEDSVSKDNTLWAAKDEVASWWVQGQVEPSWIQSDDHCQELVLPISYLQEQNIAIY
jgi:hypothetical protein